VNNLNIAKRVELASDVRRIVRDHVAGIAAGHDRKTDLYTFADGSRGRFVAERTEHNRFALRFVAAQET
jgi:hypothetical protein